MKNYTIYLLILLTVFSCKKDKQPSEQYYGEAIAESREYFPMQELFDFTTSPAMSPDGRYLAYVVPETISMERHGIWLIDVQAGGKHMFKQFATSPDWSLNGEKLCYSLNGIFISDLREDAPQLLTDENGFEPKWHPRGDTISYIHSTKGLHFINVLTKEVERITDYTGGGNHNWNVDGNTILGWKSAAPIGYFTSWDIITKELKEINPLKNSYNTNPIYSPSGAKIAFQAENGIYIINTDGSGLQQLLYNRVNRKPGKPFQPGEKHVGDMCWHPDGRHILYQQVEFISSNIAPWGFLMGEGYSTIYKLNIEQALQINKP